MSYKKGSEVLPARLLKEIQEYVEGSMIYIPKKGTKAGWGCVSGTRQAIDRRNKKIVNLYHQGEAVSSLAELFHLEEETIRKIVYKKKQV